MKRRDIERSAGSVVGGYEMHLYCSHPNHESDYHRLFGGSGTPVAESPTVFTGETHAECAKHARSLGWWISRPDKSGCGAVLCPYHNAEVER